MMNIQVGTRVWFVDNYDVLRNGIVKNIHVATHPITKEPVKYVQIYGGFASRADKCYPSEKACLDAKEEENKIAVENYKAEIHCVADLVRFAYTHNVACAEEYTDYNARKAYAERTKELLDIEL